MNLFEVLALALDPGFILRARGIEPDPWQQRLLLSEDRQVLLNCSRQSGKSTTVAVLALHTALCRAKSLVLLLSPSLRQSVELFRKVLDCFNAVRRIMPVTSLNQTRVEFRNGSRIVCLPGKEETIRSFSGVNLLVIDEAARVPDDLYRSVRPMLAVSRGRLICLSTPFGKRGFFYEEWENSKNQEPNSKNQEAGEQSRDRLTPDAQRLAPLALATLDAQRLAPLRGVVEPLPYGRGSSGRDSGGDWLRIRIPWQWCPRIEADFIELEKRSMGESWIRQEYECSFEALEGLVYPDFEEQTDPAAAGNSKNAAAGNSKNQEPNSKKQAADVGSWNLEFGSSSGGSWNLQIPAGRRVGGIDFGFRNPFCALWGVLDRDDVLWITDERYVREAPLHEHVAALRAAEEQRKDEGGRMKDANGSGASRCASGVGQWAVHPSSLILPPSGRRDAGPTVSIIWYADPAGRTEIEELRHAGLKVIRGSNAIEAGIAAINARLRTGRLKVLRPPRGDSKNQPANSKNQEPNSKKQDWHLEGGSLEFGSSEHSGCPNLLAEAKLYRYASKPEGGLGSKGSEIPIDQHNHALAALRYLVSRLDAGFMAKFRRCPGNSKNQEANSKKHDSDLEFGSCNLAIPQGRAQMRLDEAECWKTVIQ